MVGAGNIKEMVSKVVEKAFGNAEEWFRLDREEVWGAVFEGQYFDDRPTDEETKAVLNKFEAVLEPIASVLKEQTGEKVNYCIGTASLHYAYGEIEIVLFAGEKVLWREEFDYSSKWKSKEELESWIENVLSTALNRLKPVNYYQLEDDEDTYGIVATPLRREEFEKLVEEYKATDECYDNEGLVEFLKNKGYEAELIEPESVWF